MYVLVLGLPYHTKALGGGGGRFASPSSRAFFGRALFVKAEARAQDIADSTVFCGSHFGNAHCNGPLFTLSDPPQDSRSSPFSSPLDLYFFVVGWLHGCFYYSFYRQKQV